MKKLIKIFFAIITVISLISTLIIKADELTVKIEKSYEDANDFYMIITEDFDNYEASKKQQLCGIFCGFTRLESEIVDAKFYQSQIPFRDLVDRYYKVDSYKVMHDASDVSDHFLLNDYTSVSSLANADGSKQSKLVKYLFNYKVEEIVDKYIDIFSKKVIKEYRYKIIKPIDWFIGVEYLEK